MKNYFSETIESFFIPIHTEVSVYVLTLSFALTYLLNPELKSFLFETTLVDGGQRSFFMILLVLLAALSLLAVTYPKRIPLYQNLIAPVIILFTSVLLVSAYAVSLVGNGDALSLILALFHGIAVLILFRKFMHQEPNDLNWVSSDETSRLELGVATSLVVGIFVLSYGLLGQPAIWAVPISIAISLWGVLAPVVEDK